MNDQRTGSETVVQLRVYGRVQGVSFRYYTRSEAARLGIRGWVRNCPDGSVEALLCGTPECVEQMQAWLNEGPELAIVERVEVTEEAGDPEPPADFDIRY